MNNSPKQQKAAFILIMILCFAGLFAYFSLLEGHDWGGDFALYLRQTQSLLDGTSEELLAFNRYAMENSTEQMASNPQIGPHLYPWGLPILLAPVVAVTGFTLMAVKIYLIIYFLLSLWVCYALFLPRIGWVYSLWIVALLGFSPYLLTFLDSINSDIPFLFFSLLSILFIEKSLGYRRPFVNKVVTFCFTGFLICFSFLIRTNGIVLIGVLGLGHLIQYFHPLRTRFASVVKQEWRQLIPYLSFIVSFLVFKLMLPEGSGSHLAFLQRLTPGKLIWNIMYYIGLPAEFYEGVAFPDTEPGALIPVVLYGLTIPFLILGIARHWKEVPDVLYLAFSLASLFVFVIWPPVQGLRFIFPILPFYLYFAMRGFLGAEAAINRSSPPGEGRSISWASAFGAIVLMLFLIRNLAFVYEVNKDYPRRKIAEGPYTPQSQELFAFLKENSQKDDIIVFFKPRVLSFMTGHQALRVTKLSEIQEGKGDLLIYNKKIDYAQLPEEELQELQALGAQPLFENEQYIMLDLQREINNRSVGKREEESSMKH